METSSLTQRISKLSLAKRALLEAKLKENGCASAEHTITRRANRASAPLSFAQQRLWFLYQLEPDNPSYNQPKAIRLAGPLDVTALRKALDHLVERHEVLRTTFTSGDSDPVQVIDESRAVEMPLIDLRARTDTDREAEAHLHLTETIRRPFDLSRDLMLRALLIRLADQKHILLLVTHHIASDGSSTSILWRELANLYQTFTANQHASLEPLPIQYADYAIWQRHWLQGEILDNQLSYWKDQLAGAPPLLELSTDHPRPPVQTHQGARQTVVLQQELTESLKAVSRKEGVTLFMTLLAAFQTLLYRYTSQDDIVVGSPIAGRTRTEVEGLIGFFVNTLVLRSDFSGNPSFRELLARVREVALGAYAHQDLPFEKLVEELHPERNLSNSPLFQVMFGLQNDPRETLTLTGLTVSPFEIHSGAAKFDLSLSMREENEELKGAVEYNADLFDASTIARMITHFQNLLTGIVANPERRISDLPLLTDAEKRQLLVEWNDTRRDFPEDKCIHEIFEARVEQSPEAIAVVFEDQQLTYRELNNKANHLAHYLRKQGVGPDVAVGICLQRSLEIIIGVLGILKAGGAYVPLDPSYPKERLAFMLQDSRAPVLLTQQALAQALANHSNKIICLDTDWETIGQENGSDFAAETSSDNLAYVIYTSGSTGQPKGVAVSHRAVNRLVMNTDYVRLTSADVMAQASNVSFDAATFEIWGALLNGARLVLVAKDILLSPPAMSTAIEQHGITTLFLTTALFNQMVQQMPSALGKLQHLLFGGESVDPQRVKEMLHKGPPARLLHVYGPTETTTFASWYCVNAVAADAATVPIGRPIANTKIYILDSYLNPVPLGVSGEIYIGGIGLARGYLHRPELTAEKFVRNPFSREPGARLYRTGDLARYFSDGNIEFIGRLDQQVKIRGFRIEPGEIEAVLNRHPAVRKATVLVRAKTEISDSATWNTEGAANDPKTKMGNLNSDRHLVAYVVPKPDTLPTSLELRSFLKQKLPDYMVPAAFVMLDQLPLTPSGKLDRKALPAPDDTTHGSDDLFIAPRNDIEYRMAKIWESILGIQPISVKDNFFDLGGHSLLAVRLLVEIEKTIDKNLPLATIYQAPTIEQLAGILRQEEWSESQFAIWSTYPSSIVPFQPDGSKPALFWFNWGPWDFRLPRYLDSDQPVYGLQHQSQDGRRARYTGIQEMATHYIEEIRMVQAKGPYFLGGLCVGGMVTFEMARQLQKQGEEVALLVLLDPTNPRSDKLSSVDKGVPSLLSHVTRLCNKVYRHLRALAPLEPQEKLSYALVRVQDRIMGLRGTISWIGSRVLCEAFRCPLPPSLRTHYIVSIYRRAIRAYVPQLYRGRVILFKTQGRYRDGQFRWENLVAGGLEIQELDTDHDNVFKEPYVQILAERLKARLSEAQRRVTASRNSTDYLPLQ